MIKTKKNKLGGLSDKASDMVLVALSVLILIIVAYPLYYILIASVSNPYDVYAGKTFLCPASSRWRATRRCSWTTAF